MNLLNEMSVFEGVFINIVFYIVMVCMWCMVIVGIFKI